MMASALLHQSILEVFKLIALWLQRVGQWSRGIESRENIILQWFYEN